MPGWSPEIANEFIRLAAAEGRAFDQMQLQKLVYIAHGWHLAFYDEPLTGDRPEAWRFGPVYRRLAESLSGCGDRAVTQEISYKELDPIWHGLEPPTGSGPDMSHSEMDSIIMVHQDFGRLSAAQLSSVTQRPGTPWAHVFADGRGEFRDIPHRLIRAQFVEFAQEPENQEGAPPTVQEDGEDSG